MRILHSEEAEVASLRWIIFCEQSHSAKIIRIERLLIVPNFADLEKCGPARDSNPMTSDPQFCSLTSRRSAVNLSTKVATKKSPNEKLSWDLNEILETCISQNWEIYFWYSANCLKTTVSVTFSELCLANVVFKG